MVLDLIEPCVQAPASRRAPAAQHSSSRQAVMTSVDAEPGVLLQA